MHQRCSVCVKRTDILKGTLYRAPFHLRPVKTVPVPKSYVVSEAENALVRNSTHITETTIGFIIFYMYFMATYVCTVHMYNVYSYIMYLW